MKISVIIRYREDKIHIKKLMDLQLNLNFIRKKNKSMYKIEKWGEKVQPAIFMSSVSVDSTNCGWKIFGKKNSEISKKPKVRIQFYFVCIWIITLSQSY